MVANYTKTNYIDEQDFVVQLDDFLVNHVGWYRFDTISDTVSNRDYVFSSDGEPDRYENTNPRFIRFRGQSSYVYVYTYATYTNSVTHTEETSDATYGRIGGVSSGGTVEFIADKERVMASVNYGNTNNTRQAPSYCGRVDPFFTTEQHPYPNLLRGSYLTTSEWGGISGEDRAYAISPQGNLRIYYIWNLQDEVNSAVPLYRNGKYVTMPAIVYGSTVGDEDLLGHARGAYQISNYVPVDAFITLASGTYKCLTAGASNSPYNWVYGPLTDPLIGDINREPPTTASVDYDFRGFITDVNTEANWRLDTDLGGVYQDQVGNYNLAPVNSPVLVNSPLVQGVQFNGSTQYATVSGVATTASDLLGEWTCEVLFKPDTIPGSGKDTIIEFGFNSDGTESQNTLLSISVAPGGNLEVFWERGAAGTDEINTTTGNFIELDRWNYVSVVKKDVGGSNYDIEVWHSSFGDHRPVLRETFSSVANATGGADSFWFLGTDASLTSYYDGTVDAIRIQKQPLTPQQIISSFLRVRL